MALGADVDSIKRRIAKIPPWKACLSRRPDLIDKFRAGIVFWHGVQVRAGLAGPVRVWVDQGGVEFEALAADVDAILSAYLDGLTCAVVGACGDQWTAQQLDTVSCCLGVIDEATGQCRSSIIVGGDGVSISRDDDVTAPEGLRDALESFLSGEAIDMPALPFGFAKVSAGRDGTTGWQKLRALNCFGDAAAQRVVGSGAVSGDTSWFGTHRSAFFFLDAPVVCGDFESADSKALYAFHEHGIDAPVLRLDAFEFSPRDLVALSNVSVRMAGDVARLPIATKATLLQWLRKWYASRESVAVFRAWAPRPGQDVIKFLVPGWIPMGGITLLAGGGATGKSTALHHLALIVGTPPAERDPAWSWLGVGQKEIADGVVVFASGEDDAATMHERARQLGLEGPNLFCLDVRGKSLASIVEVIKTISNAALVILDPLRSFLDGDEDSSDTANAFFNSVVEFAVLTGCAVVVAHHLKKNSHVNALRGPLGILGAIRGSGAITERPRCVVGMIRRGAAVEVAVVKKNVPTTHPMAEEPRLFTVDQTTMRLLPSGARAPAIASAPDASDMDAVRRALEEATNAGMLVARTGRRELHSIGSTHIAGLSRARVRAAVSDAIAKGHFVSDASGYLAESIATGEPSLPVLPESPRPLPATATSSAT
jgi:hypothetical protein